MLELKISDGVDGTTLRLGDDWLVYSAEIGGPVMFNGNIIPGEKIWSMLVGHAADGEPLELNRLFDAARGSETYRLEPQERLVITDNPLPTDRELPIEGAYLRTEPQRVRPMFKDWDILVAMIAKKEPLPADIDTMVVAAEALGYSFVDEINDRYYAVKTEDQLAFMLSITGGRPVKPSAVAKFMKRPGSTALGVKFTGSRFPEADNDGTIGIVPGAPRPMQGTFIADDGGDVVLAKGIVRPPLMIQSPRGDILTERPQYVATGAFDKPLPAKGAFYAISNSTRERCTLNYQTAVFSFKDPAALIRADTEALDMSAEAQLSDQARAKVAAGIPMALLIGDFSPWSLAAAFSRPGIRATVFGSYLVKPGTFGLVSRSFRQLADLIGEDPTGKTFLVHRDPALPDGTSTYAARCVGELHFACTDTHRGVVINPKDTDWFNAGGDFDGDSASIFVGGPEDLIQKVKRRSLKQKGSRYTGMDLIERFKDQLTDRTTSLLGPLVLNTMKLTERGLLGPSLAAEAATAIQASVEAKKHPVDGEEVARIAEGVFSRVYDENRATGMDFMSTSLNRLKSAIGDAAKLAAWKDLVNNAVVVLNSTIVGPNTAERALAERIMVIDELYNDIGFLRSMVRAEMPSLLKNRAKDVSDLEASEYIHAMTKEYLATMALRESTIEMAARQGGDPEEFEEQIQEMRREIAGMRQRFRYYLKLGDGEFTAEQLQIAMIAYGPPKLAAQFCSLETFQSLAVEAKEAIVSLKDHGWEAGTYRLADLDPIPNCVPDILMLGDPETEVTLVPMHLAARSTRVHLRAVKP